ncbi:bifunctional 4-hydroxy-2-oxoglutarate aldolase/2-dehydro-3-deoxy-phosphogluconate aldolase [Bifidobacterium sp. ESL0763]|uniref:bifunctional 4-hydroxy-2-oxoglutarate aldolase/2-dehydro-3-deoxy-phosphogluconate aldolase n=1 Tax=Bifidobacterium sp. ESL0763 TaxID=2983227 RepID=UPI0023F9414E|nr:bifunctional 4-hydroxy-2-oxoglutarate aldolase/2-dehydro-3-deoxy-phosphogluconate aldolase [Bifidobacterium sp. ESL0763]MDF7663356.1 bifunctional 4-hydroxy-2-oxoglutarate aldolase/2-dehydro-3-deoxy-phosphogluconate aldolase [Bifidobacterium sp. ESL0763]
MTTITTYPKRESHERLSLKEQTDYLCSIGVIPLVTFNTPDEAVPLARALAAGGVPVAEVTFRSAAALEGMRRIHAEVPEVTLMAGTVHTVRQAHQAIEAGCTGIVTPDFDEQVVDWCMGDDILVVPGTAVPTDVEKAWDRGLRYVKFFPAEAYGGVKTLKALNGPFSDMKFLPTGGVSLKNLKDYISLPNVFAVGGSFPVPKDAQNSGDWDAITKACKQARELVKPIIEAKNA